MEKREVARILRDTSQLLAIDGGNLGRWRSYEKAADLLDGLNERIEDIANDEEKLQELSGVGEGMPAISTRSFVQAIILCADDC